jgi:hypothetical protein
MLCRMSAYYIHSDGEHRASAVLLHAWRPYTSKYVSSCYVVLVHTKYTLTGSIEHQQYYCIPSVHIHAYCISTLWPGAWAWAALQLLPSVHIHAYCISSTTACLAFSYYSKYVSSYYIWGHIFAMCPHTMYEDTYLLCHISAYYTTYWRGAWAPAGASPRGCMAQRRFGQRRVCRSIVEPKP